MSKSTKIFVVEGEDRDLRILNSLIRGFFKGKYEAQIISLPASQNIYMLYNIMRKDGFESDIVEILRDNILDAREKLEGTTRQDVDEVFLFFDFDLHQDNLPSNLDKKPVDVLKELVSFFDNETENGKLYISYPMIEAAYDFNIDKCASYTQCYFPIEKFARYKTLAGDGNSIASWHFGYNEWAEAIKAFALRVQCLFDNSSIDHKYYREIITAANILEKQIKCAEDYKSVFVLGACPEFLLDYFNIAFWIKHFRVTNDLIGRCELHK